MDSKNPGFLLRSNPGLELANAFGVLKLELIPDLLARN